MLLPCSFLVFFSFKFFASLIHYSQGTKNQGSYVADRFAMLVDHYYLKPTRKQTVFFEGEWNLIWSGWVVLQHANDIVRHFRYFRPGWSLRSQNHRAIVHFLLGQLARFCLYKSVGQEKTLILTWSSCTKHDTLGCCSIERLRSHAR